jgi:hypothetical protein
MRGSKIRLGNSKIRSFISCTIHNIMLVIKSRELKWVGCVACICVAEKGNAYRVRWRKL